MNILLTNDDGINSQGLLLLAEELRKRDGDRILVLAPDRERSGVSHSIEFIRKPVRLKVLGTDVWSSSGNPADCVALALQGALPVRPDLVVSGINRGANLGTDLVFSGTAAAARHAALYGVPAVALSLVAEDKWQWGMASRWAAENLDTLREKTGPDIFINVNIPNREEGPGGMEDCFPSKRLYNDELEVHKVAGWDDYCFIRLGTIDTLAEAGSDLAVVSRNLAAVTPVYIHPVWEHDISPKRQRPNVPII